MLPPTSKQKTASVQCVVEDLSESRNIFEFEKELPDVHRLGKTYEQIALQELRKRVNEEFFSVREELQVKTARKHFVLWLSHLEWV